MCLASVRPGHCRHRRSPTSSHIFFQKDLCRGLLWNLDQVFGQSGEPTKRSELCARCETDIDIVTDSPHSNLETSIYDSRTRNVAPDGTGRTLAAVYGPSAWSAVLTQT